MVERSFVKGTWQRERAFSPAVSTRGGRIVWVAGHGATRDSDGNSLAGDFTAQTHQSFRNMETSLKAAGATLADVTTMTVFITDARYGNEFVSGCDIGQAEQGNQHDGRTDKKRYQQIKMQGTVQ